MSNWVNWYTFIALVFGVMFSTMIKSAVSGLKSKAAGA